MAYANRILVTRKLLRNVMELSRGIETYDTERNPLIHTRNTVLAGRLVYPRVMMQGILEDCKHRVLLAQERAQSLLSDCL